MKISHVLVLDRDLVRRESLVRTLKADGQVPVVVDSADSAARALAVPGLDLAVLDLGLPGLAMGQLRAALAPENSLEPEPLEAIERQHIARTLAYTGGNKRRTAQILGIARSTLLAKVRKYGLAAGQIEVES